MQPIININSNDTIWGRSNPIMLRTSKNTITIGIQINIYKTEKPSIFRHIDSIRENIKLGLSLLLIDKLQIMLNMIETKTTFTKYRTRRDCIT